MDEIAAALLTWIALNSTYDVAQAPVPRIVLQTPEQMVQRFRTLAGQSRPAPAIESRVHGHFERAPGRTGTIYIVEPKSTPRADEYPADPASNPWFRERLLHELVHFAQHHTGAYQRFECPIQAEYDAYVLGGRYLAQLRVRDPMPDRQLIAVYFRTC